MILPQALAHLKNVLSHLPAEEAGQGGEALTLIEKILEERLMLIGTLEGRKE